jgi:hypothetical protein
MTVMIIRWFVLLAALVWLAPMTAAAAQPDCYLISEANVEMQDIRQRLSFDSPTGELDEWIRIMDPYQVRAAFRAIKPDLPKAALYQLQHLYLLKLPNGDYRGIHVANQRAGGFANDVPFPSDLVGQMFAAVEKVRAEQSAPKADRYPGSPELEELYYLTRDAHSSSSDYPSTCVELDAQDGTEPREPVERGTFQGEPVIYLSHRSLTKPAEDLFFHILGPYKYQDFVWADGVMLRERGALTDIILVANYNACGFDGRVSFPTDQVQEWLDTRPNNRVTFEPGDPMPMTPHQRQELKRFLENPKLLLDNR